MSGSGGVVASHFLVPRFPVQHVMILVVKREEPSVGACLRLKYRLHGTLGTQAGQGLGSLLLRSERGALFLKGTHMLAQVL